MDPYRAERVSEALREELSEIIGYEMADPRIGAVTVTGVHVDPGMRHARVQVQVSGGEQEQRESLEALEKARTYLRRQVAARLTLFRVPELHFEPDLPGDALSRMEQLLKRARRGRPKAGESSES
jgi:ribosome-binding factor A